VAIRRIETTLEKKRAGDRSQRGAQGGGESFGGRLRRRLATFIGAGASSFRACVHRSGGRAIAPVQRKSLSDNV
jgi:hypothetical protein